MSIRLLEHIQSELKAAAPVRTMPPEVRPQGGRRGQILVINR